MAAAVATAGPRRTRSSQLLMAP